MSNTDTGFSPVRRLILKAIGSAALIGLGAVPLRWPTALAAANDKYPEEAFKQKNEADAIKALYGKTAEPSEKVNMDAPEIAENGAAVAISVTTTLADVTSAAKKYIHPEKLAILVVGNGSEIKPGLDDLKLGPIQPVDITIPQPARPAGGR